MTPPVDIASIAFSSKLTKTCLTRLISSTKCERVFHGVPWLFCYILRVLNERQEMVYDIAFKANIVPNPKLFIAKPPLKELSL